ncbi:MAG: exonuclease domain-containing protein [Lachnospiraceae bacterium]|nr:exonuclease domain-containing protein [Lachnospiraceae bacterium]
MNYIVFDLEWNQGKLGKKDSRHSSLPFEIIEIGAIKLDEDRNVTGRFHELIKPQVYKEMPRLIEDMLHVDMQKLQQGRRFEDVCEDFLEWCGEDYVFCTWGNQDLLELQRNMLYFGLEPISFGPLEYFDVQKLFSIDCEDGKSRRNLEYAVDFLSIEKDIPFHSAYTDACYTARVLEKIDKSVEEYCSYDVFWLPADKEEEVHKIFPSYSKYISRQFDDKHSALSDKEVIGMRCYICDKNTKKKIRWFSTGGRNYICVTSCPQHGLMKGKIRIRKHTLTERDEEAVYVDKTQKLIDEEQLKELLEKRDKVLSMQKKKNHHKKKPADTDQ